MQYFMKNRKLGQPVRNKYKVPKKLWDKFSNHAKQVFNNVFYSMRPSLQWAFKHPNATIETRTHWQTTQWNAAMTAAWAADGTPQIERVINVTTKKTKHVK